MVDLGQIFEGRSGRQVTKGELEVRSEFLPVLNPPRWHGERRAMARRLMADAGDESPWVALGLNVGHAFAYPPPESEWVEEEFDEMLPAAVDHLVQRADRPRWRLATDQADGKILIRQGDDLTASDVLDPAVLNQAATLLNSATIRLALPSRRTMVAYVPEEEPVAQLLVRRLFEEAVVKRHEPLSPLALSVLNGQLRHLIVPEKPAGEVPEQVPEPVAAPSVRESDFPPKTTAAPKSLLLTLVALAAVAALVLAVLVWWPEPTAQEATSATFSTPDVPAQPAAPPPAEPDTEPPPLTSISKASVEMVQPLPEVSVLSVTTGPATGVRLWRMPVKQQIRALTLSPATQRLMVRTADRMQVLDLTKRTYLRTLHGVFGVMSADGRYVANRAEQVQTVYVWQASDGQQVHATRLPAGTWQEVFLAPGGDLFVCIGEKVTAVTPDSETPAWNLYFSDISASAISPHGKRLALLRPVGLTVLDLRTGYKVAGTSLASPISGPVCFASLSTVVAGDEGRVMIFSEDLDIDHTLAIPSDARLLDATLGGSLIAIATPRDILVISGDDGRPLVRVPHTDGVSHAILTEDEQLLTVTGGNLLTCWDVSVRP